jgi:entericidin B
MNRLIARLLACCVLASFAVSFVGCNTVEGAGKDVESGGRAVKNTARDAKD